MGGRANSQPPAEVLSGGSCVPPDSWHDGGRGSAPTSCAQLSPRPHIASPAVPSPAAGLLNWRFVPAQGNNTGLVGGGGEYGGKEEKARELGVLQEDVGGPCIAGLPEGAETGGLNSRQPRKERVGTGEGRAPQESLLGRGTRGPMLQDPAVDIALKAQESLRKHLTEALVGESSGPCQPLLSASPEVPPGKHLGSAGPGPRWP